MSIRWVGLVLGAVAVTACFLSKRPDGADCSASNDCKSKNCCRGTCEGSRW